MKPIFCIDITNDKKNETVNGGEFIVASVSSETSQTYDKKRDDVMEIISKSQHPLWLRIVEYVSGFAAFACVVGIIRSIGNVTLAQAYKNAPGIFWVGGICAVLWAVLFISSKIRKNKVESSPEATALKEHIDKDVKMIFDELGVPENAEDVDVMTFSYIIKNGKTLIRKPSIDGITFYNALIKIYRKDDALCIADLKNNYEFPINMMKEISTVNKTVSMVGWSKDESPFEGRYKKYKIRISGDSMPVFKPYHILKIYDGNEEYGIYFPCYELEIFEKLTGLRAE